MLAPEESDDAAVYTRIAQHILTHTAAISFCCCCFIFFVGRNRISIYHACTPEEGMHQ
jgi:hypothetical protein